MPGQEVVMIQDSAAKVSVSFMKWALKGLPFTAGDRLTLISVLHQVNTPLGYVRVDSSSLNGANPRIIESEASKIQQQYQNHDGIIQIYQLYQKRKIVFNIEVATGPSTKIVGVEAARNLNATLIILDRAMKNDAKYFLGNLECGVWRIKGDCKVEQLRRPNKPSDSKSNRHNSESASASTSTATTGAEQEGDQDLFSIEL